MMQQLDSLTRFLIPLLAFTLAACGSNETANTSTLALPDGEVVVDSVESENAAFRVVKMVDSLDTPWGIDWLPDGRALITERPGQMVLINGNSRTSLSGVPEVWAEGQGGLLDVRVGPNYGESGWIYFTYSSMQEDSTGGTVLSRARLQGNSLTNVEEIYRQTPFLEPTIHFGSRIVFPNDSTLVVALGERGQRRQRNVDIPTPSTSVGTTVRLRLDGSVPEDNPFVGQDDALPEVYSYGHRNPQGMAIHPATGASWLTEHGPHGGDELNLVEPGNNYGWPAVSYGDTYSTPHEEIGGTEGPGLTQPVNYWDPSPALSGLSVYTGDKFPGWQNHLFLGALAQQKIIRVELNDQNEVAHEEDLITKEIGRIRDVSTGPDGYLYILTDSGNGGLYRLEPVGGSTNN